MGKPVPGTSPIDVGEVKTCCDCDRGVMQSGAVHFYELTIVQCVVDMPNIQRMHGLELMMGRAIPLARVFSPDNTVAHRMDVSKKRRWICADCAMRSPQWPIGFLLEDDAEERHAAAIAEKAAANGE